MHGTNVKLLPYVAFISQQPSIWLAHRACPIFIAFILYCERNGYIPREVNRDERWREKRKSVRNVWRGVRTVGLISSRIAVCILLCVVYHYSISLLVG